MPRIYDAASDPIDFCRDCFPDEVTADHEYGDDLREITKVRMDAGIATATTRSIPTTTARITIAATARTRATDAARC